jgi:hypothetical protein
VGWTAIDAHWWFGGNKRRGIGEYLLAYFSGHSHIPRTQRHWIVPVQASQADVQELLAQLGGESIALPEVGVTAAWIAELKERGCQQVFFASPFERPNSLLDFWPAFSAAKIRGEAVLFDLLPLQFPSEILASWPSADQLQYRVRVEYMKQLDFLWCISPATQKVAQKLLDKEVQKMKVLAFGLKTNWIEIPESLSKAKLPRDPQLTVTISGGEWRKNLEGTIEHFLKNFGSTDRLIVICKLGKKHRWRLMWLLLVRGASRRVTLAGEVSEEQKWRHLLEAQNFLFLSRAEGLGIPLLEAQKAKIPNIYMSSVLIQDGLGVLVKSPIPVVL